MFAVALGGLAVAACQGDALDTGDGGDFGAVEAALITTTLTPPVADAMINGYSSIEDDQNFGSAQTLPLWGGVQHALIQFSETAIRATTGDVVRARLRFRITGGELAGATTLSVHRVVRAWTENAVTWNCSTDTNLGNSNPDCLPQWDPRNTHPVNGPYAATPTHTVPVASVTPGTIIEIDVTPDIARVISGEAHYGWFLRISGESSLTLASKENTTYADPELIIDTAESTFVPTACPAPGLDESRITRVVDVVGHVYTGSCPVQFGTTPSQIDPQRAAHMRGRVVGANGAAVSGVTVRIVGLPEVGWTRTRSDGWWDLVVNGGGPMVVEFSKTGYIGVQRRVELPWNDYHVLDNVVLLQRQVLGECEAVSAGTADFYLSPTTEIDGRGSRRLAAYIPSTVSVMDGSTPLTSYYICGREYTVDRTGGAGELAMPGELPPTSGFTYASELEVRTTSGTVVADPTFSAPVFVYVKANNFPDNTSGFPVGTVIPSGNYDRSRAGWEAGSDGRVVRVVSDGAAGCAFDVTGDGNWDTSIDGSAAHDQTSAERAQLTSRCGTEQAFQVNDIVWRIPVTHFSPWDWNWAVDFIANALIPSIDWTNEDQNSCQVSDGSIIGCDTQTLGEAIPLTGTPWALHYQSERQRGRRDRYRLDVRFGGTPVNGGTGTPPTTVRVRAQVAGKSYDADVAYSTGHYEIVWDGRDVWNRNLQGAQPITVRVGYVYPANYAPASGSTGVSFELPAGSGVSLSAAREVVFWTTRRTLIGGWDEGDPDDEIASRGRGLGGWSITPHHVYDAHAGVLYRGDGTTLTTRGIEPVIGTLYDGGAVAPKAIAVAPDGSVYFAVTGGHRVYRIDPSGVVTSFVGTGENVPFQDGPIGAATIDSPIDLAIDQLGALYILEQGGRIRRVADGAVSTLVFGLTSPQALAVGPSGSLFVTEQSTPGRIRGVRPDGTTFTFYEFPGEYYNPRGIAVNVAGEVFVGVQTIAGAYVRRIRPTGSSDAERASTYGGNGGGLPCPWDGDGGPATAACVNEVTSLVLGSDGSLYVAEVNTETVRRISPAGVIDRIAGTGEPPCTVVGHPECSPLRLLGDGGPARNAHFLAPTDVALRSDGTVYIADEGGTDIRVVRPALPDSVVGESVVAEPGGGVVYRFDERGRHIRTEHGLTGGTLLTFSYFGSGGRLSGISQPGTSLGITITPNAYGFAGTINTNFAAGSDPTLLQIDGDTSTAYLDWIRDPSGQQWSFGYDPGAGREGLLSTLTDPRDGEWSFQFDTRGLLTDDYSPGRNQFLGRMACGAGLNCAPGENGWSVARQFEDATWGPDWYSVIRAGGMLTRSHVSPLGAVAASQIGDLDPEDAINDHLTLTAYTNDLATENEVLAVTSRSFAAHGTITRAATGQDPRPGLSAFARAVQIERPVSVTHVTPVVTDVSVHRSIVPTNAATLADITQFTENVVVNGTRRTTVARTVNDASSTCRESVALTTPSRLYTSTACLDALGRVTSLTQPGLAPITFEYGAANGRPSRIVQGVRDTRIQYVPPAGGNAQWWPGTISAYQGATEAERIELSRNAQGAVTNVTHRNLLKGTSSPIGITRDELGRATAVTAPNTQTHGLVYTGLGATATYSPPTVGAGQPGVMNVPIFDAAHRPESLQIRNGLTVVDTLDYVYDETYGHLSEVQLPGLRSLQIARNVGSPADGRVRSLALDGTTVTYDYDGPAVAKETWSGNVVGSVSSVLDNYGELDQLRIVGVCACNSPPPTSTCQSGCSCDPDCAANPGHVNYSFDADGRLTQAGAEVLLTSVVSGRWQVDSTMGSSTARQRYDAYGAIDYVYTKYGTPYQFLYDLDERDYLGREIEVIEVVQGTSAYPTYEYDGHGRLYRVRRNSIIVAEYGYDANGNREYVTYSDAWNALPDVSSASTTYDAQDRMTSYGGCSYTYTTAGMLQTKTCSGVTTTYNYDLLGNLLSVSGLPGSKEIHYDWDGAGRRIRRRVKVSGVFDSNQERRYLYSTGIPGPVAELNASGALLRVFVWGARPNVPDYMIDVAGGGATYRLVTDPRGTVRLVVNTSTGAVVSRIDYDAFGAILTASSINPGYQPFGFAGGLYDPETGLVRFGARDYDPVTGRWTTKDPSGFASGDTNLYRYVFGDPINLVDPTGRAAEILVLGGAIGTEAGAGAGLVAILSNPVVLAVVAVAVVAVVGYLIYRQYTDEEQALQDLVDDASCKGTRPLSDQDADAVIDLGRGIGYPNGFGADQGDTAVPNHWVRGPHIHVPGAGRGGSGHVPVRGGFRPTGGWGRHW